MIHPGAPILPPVDGSQFIYYPSSFPNSLENKINFNRFVDPLVQSLTFCTLSVTRVILLGALHVLNFALTILSAAQVVFSRIIFSPRFNPFDPSFNELILNFQRQLNPLRERVVSLDIRFKFVHLVRRDLLELMELNLQIKQTLQQLDNFVGALEDRENPVPIQKLLTETRDNYQSLSDEIDRFCSQEPLRILKGFNSIFELFTQAGLNLSKDVKQDLIQMWKVLDNVIRPRLFWDAGKNEASKLFSDLSEKMRYIDLDSQGDTIGVAEPLKLRNIGNSCYMDSVIQALFCVDQICEQLTVPISREKIKPEEYAKKAAIQQEILQFLNVKHINQNSRNYTQLEFILFLLEGPSLYRLRNEIFKSKFHHEFEMAHVTKQLDAASMMEFFIDQFLPNCKFKIQKHATTPVFPGMEWIGREEELTMLQVPLRKPEDQELGKLIHWELYKRRNKEGDRKFLPKDGKVIDVEKAAPLLDAKEQKVPEYIEWNCVRNTPPVLALHFKRFLNDREKPGELWKDSRPVDLPRDGIIDLKKYHDPSEGTSEETRYKIKSYVVHSGYLHGGHYIACVEIKGKYYYCDDLTSKCYREITREEFFGRKDPYLMVLERLDTISEETQGQ